MSAVCFPRATWGSKECGDYKSVFTYQLITVGLSGDRIVFVNDLLSELWEHRYVIREEAHGIPQPSGDQDSQDAEFFDTENLPLAWTRWLSLPEQPPSDAPTSERDAVFTKGDIDLTRQNSRRQSATLHRLMDKAWVTLTEMAGDVNTVRMMEKFTVKGDVSKLQRVITFVIDGFETLEEGIVNPDRVQTLRDLVLYFIHNPTSDSASGFNAYIKKRALQWYSMAPGSSMFYLNAGARPQVMAWNKYLVRTPAARSLSKLLEARRFYARSHKPMTVSYNKISTVCKRLFSSDDPWKRGVALMFALGVRPNELFRSFVTFKPIGPGWVSNYSMTDKSSWLIQIGTSKCANASKLMTEADDIPLEDKRCAEKPILFGFKSADVIEAIHRLRMDADKHFSSSVIAAGLSLAEAPTSAITLTVVQRLSRAIYAAFPDEGDTCTERGHLFGALFSRKFYACAAIKEFEDSYKDTVTPSQFVAEILMHQPGMPFDSVHYVTIRLLYGEEDPVYIDEEKDEDGQRKKRKSGDDPEGTNKKRKRKKTPIDGDGLYSLTDEVVMLKTMTPERSKVEVKRFCHRKFNTEEERQEYFNAAKQYLLSFNVRASIANLTAIGVSPQFQSARKKNYKKAIDELNKAQEEANEIRQKVNELETEIKQQEESAEEDDNEEDGDGDIVPSPLKRQKASMVN